MPRPPGVGAGEEDGEEDEMLPAMADDDYSAQLSWQSQSKDNLKYGPFYQSSDLCLTLCGPIVVESSWTILAQRSTTVSKRTVGTHYQNKLSAKSVYPFIQPLLWSQCSTR